MALRTVCAAALLTGTDLGVNNARAFVTTGMESICIWQFLKYFLNVLNIENISVGYISCSRALMHAVPLQTW